MSYPEPILLSLWCLLCFFIFSIAFAKIEKTQASIVAFRATGLDSKDKMTFKSSVRGEKSVALQTNFFTDDFYFNFSPLEKTSIQLWQSFRRQYFHSAINRIIFIYVDRSVRITNIAQNLLPQSLQDSFSWLQSRSHCFCSIQWRYRYERAEWNCQRWNYFVANNCATECKRWSIYQTRRHFRLSL